MLTYRCNAECADCYVSCSPRNRRTLPVEDLRRYLRELKRLGLRGRDIHFGGGEPFFDYAHLIRCFEVAREEGMLPLGKLETNGFWCKSERMARRRLTEIAGFGVLELVISSDAFHQEFVPVETVQRAHRIAREILGARKVRVNVQEFLDDPIDVMALTADERTDVFRDVLRKHPWRLVGRAAKTLAHLGNRRPREAFARDRCGWKLLGKRSIHIDPYGNVFPSICSGIILGNANREPLSQIWRNFAYGDHPMLKTLAERGPVPLLEEAVRHGFQEDGEGYASKCHLCFAARGFFAAEGLHPAEVGPREIYAN